MSEEFMFEEGLVTTYTPGRQERAWMEDTLGPFFEDQWFSDILYQAKGGKEATVYCCRGLDAANMPLVAAKIYRPRMFRAMRNDWYYKQGRTAMDAEGKAVYRGKSLRATQKDTRMARQIHTASWCAHEFSVMQQLHEAGGDVPRPLTSGENAVLCEFIGDENGAAPVLHSVRMSPEKAEPLLTRLLWNIRLMLQLGLIHADLSAHNVLYWNGRAVLIDFPQTVDAQRHPDAFTLLCRDIERLCQYFARQGLPVPQPQLIAQELWTRMLRGELEEGNSSGSGRCR